MTSFSTLLSVAAFAVACTHLSLRYLAGNAYKREEKRHLSRTSERFCDELMELVVAYWASPITDGNQESKQAVDYKISAYSFLCAGFLSEHFPNNTEINNSMRLVSLHVPVSQESNEAPAIRAAKAVGALVKLRFAIMHAMNPKSPKQLERWRSRVKKHNQE